MSTLGGYVVLVPVPGFWTSLKRVPLWAPTPRESRKVLGDRATKIQVLDDHELAAGRLAALLARGASRDLFDARQLLAEHVFGPDKRCLAFLSMLKATTRCRGSHAPPKTRDGRSMFQPRMENTSRGLPGQDRGDEVNMVEQIPSEVRSSFGEARDTPHRRAAAQDACQRLAAEGFPLHPRGRELLALVLGLTIHPNGPGADGVVPDPISFNPLAAASGERDRVQECEDACQTSLMPLGEVGMDLLLMASDGRLVLARPSEATVLGPDEASGWVWLLQRIGAPVDIDVAAHALLLRWLRARAFTVRRAEEVELTPRLRHDLHDPTVQDDARLFLAIPKPFGLGLSLSGVTFTGARLSSTVTVYETMDATTGQSVEFVLPRVHRGRQGYRILAFFEDDEARSLCRRMVDAMTRQL